MRLAGLIILAIKALEFFFV